MKNGTIVSMRFTSLVSMLAFLLIITHTKDVLSVFSIVFHGKLVFKKLVISFTFRLLFPINYLTLQLLFPLNSLEVELQLADLIGKVVAYRKL